ncbi:MAG: isoamylase early set domain-containing protein [Phaeodactylibacter sp.]|nr:isoamylase early set domain-containing protein [Phaeodactylibacter sp.]
MIKKQFLKSKPVCKATFTVAAEAVENAETVAIVGEFNDWNTTEPVEMKKLKDGSFKATVELESGREYQFRYIIDGEKWENDWQADKYVATPFGVDNSVVIAMN